MFDELVLYLSAAVEIQMEVDGCGLDVVMSQAVSDICQGVAAQQHIHRTGMTKAMDRVDMLESFGGESPGEVFPTDPVDAVACEWFSPLVDKKIMSI